MEKKTKAPARPKAAASSTTRRAAKSPVAAKAAPKTAAKPRARATKDAPAIAASAAVTAQPSHAPNREQVAQVAYSLFEQSGHQHGRALEHWLEAESRLSRGMKL